MITFEDPNGRVTPEVDLALLETAVTKMPADYWSGEVGTAVLRADEGSPSLYLLPSLEHGRFYIKYRLGPDEWLSQGDPSRWTEHWACADEWYASAGLFVAPLEAWSVVQEFIRNGQRSGVVNWIRPQDVPAEGTW